MRQGGKAEEQHEEGGGTSMRINATRRQPGNPLRGFKARAETFGSKPLIETRLHPGEVAAGVENTHIFSPPVSHR